jgi:hypothetical protein
MDMLRISRIAAKVSGTQVQLQGPFNKGSSPKNSVDIDIPFGISGGAAPLILEAIGEDPKNLNAVQQVERGPVPEVSIGYSVVKDNYNKSQVGPSWTSPGDPDEYDFEIKVTHLNGLELSDVDRATLDKAGLTKIVHDAVYDKHAEKAALRSQDFGD